ncbi:HD domain-containing phosphohydrolase [Saccharospirillum salsuginis]|uniref:Two-component system response regulator n=1 Tax=Saccharospirillum salsuginis TaxID=418750 RepID=A0A918KB58_9GAMM|nr:HD domain-containing phosphohydrolase [Saccharospirillum salsuginis]GGX56816.1 two-component system response regulator [Saccharospirillum salsuginis]
MTQTQGDTTATDKVPASRVLVVDDESNIRKSLERLLRRRGYEVVQAESVARAKGVLANAGDVDLIITDLKMPGEDGIALLIHAADHYPSIPRILLTGHADLEQTMRAINEGCSGQILTKPWEDNHLLRVVAEQLERSQLQRKNAQLLKLNQKQNAQLREMNKLLEERVQARTAQLKASADTLKKSNKSLLQSYKSTVRLVLELASMNPAIDSDLAQDMSELGVTLALSMELKPADVSAIRYACQLHELGKLALPQDIATSREALLSSSEWKTYSQYPEQGSLALTSVEYLSSVSQLIANHREHWDGTGFPRNLEGEEIPLGSRVVLMCRDYVQALNKYKNKKEAIGKRAGDMNIQLLAFEEIEQWRDVRYDGALVDVLKDTLAVREVEEEGGSDAPRGHLVSAQSIEPGMVLAQDVYTDKDLLMLTKGQKLTARHIEKLLAMETEYGRDLSIYIQS